MIFSETHILLRIFFAHIARIIKGISVDDLYDFIESRARFSFTNIHHAEVQALCES
ncbi:Uncharacterised protein [Vibrio cholerae]|uniref:Uncharacterized protein n=1 Tax=Vibrio cholerae TaxID=666 RepID=A0A655Q4H1_VIBCL|nr:Uncharacterised protein [Vibrio cholerae]CSB47946.1 Uncharacterised protein [Vibrio cholerae]CSB87708.1 Uncharacterised protein [Vibrio cholerae]CSI76930.1 Uncharacterised protein [Vibrio cholerae]